MNQDESLERPKEPSSSKLQGIFKKKSTTSQNAIKAEGSKVNSEWKDGNAQSTSQRIPSNTKSSGKGFKDPKKSKKGLARVAVFNKMIHGIIKKSKLEITSLHIQKPTGQNVYAIGKIKLTNLVTGPIPLVGLRLHFKDQEGVALTWTPSDQQSSGKSTEKTVIQAFIEPLDLLPNKVGTITSEIKIRFDVNQSSHDSFVRFVRHILRSDATQGTKVVLGAKQAEVKVYGMRFGGLSIEKEIRLGGFGCLNGALIFDDTGMYGTGQIRSQKQNAVRTNINGTAKDVAERTPLHDPQSKKKNVFSKRQKSPTLRTDRTRPAKGVAKQDASLSEALTIEHLEIVGGHPQDGMQLSASLILHNPATDPELSIQPGELRLVVCVRDDQSIIDNVQSPPQKYKFGTVQLPPGLFCVGSLILPPVTLKPGPNKIDANLFIIIPDPPSERDSPSSFIARAHKAGQQLVANLMQDEPIENTCVVSTPYNESSLQNGTSDIRWIADAFAGVRIEYRIPPLGERVHLLDGAELRVEGGQEGGERGSRSWNASNSFDISRDSLPSALNNQNNLKESVARATLRNGFEADIHVHSLKVNICSEPLFGEDGRTETLRLGGLSSPLTTSSPTGLPWEGLWLSRDHPTHVSLPMEINPDPRVLIEILRKSARMRNIDLGNPLSELLEDLRKAHWNEAGFAEPPQSRPASRAANSSRRSSINPPREPEPSDDLAGLLANALGNLRVTAEIEAEVSIGDYRIPGAVEIEQRNLPIALSTATAAALLPLIGKPFVKALVDRAEVDVQHVDVTSMDDRGVLARVTLGLSNFGPLHADATFDEGLFLRDPNDTSKTIAIIYFENPLSVTAGDETPIVADCRISPPTGSGGTERFSRFINQLLRADTITLSVLAEPLSISAGGIHFSAVLEKMITVMGLGGFSNLRMEDLQIVGETSAPAAGVSISVAAPANSAHNTAISISTIAKVHNAGDIHLRITKLEVAIVKDDVHIGQASIDDVDLKARSTAALRVKGTLYAPPAREGEIHTKAIERLNALISTLIAGKEAKVDIVGRRAWVPATKGSRPVSLAWLDESLRMFKTEASIQWKGGVQIVEKIDVGKIDATFAARRGLQLKIDDIIAQYSVPFPIQFELQSIDASMEIMFGNKVIAKCHAAQDTIENVQSVTEQRGGRSNSVALPPNSSTGTSNTSTRSPLLRKSVTGSMGHTNGGSTTKSSSSGTSPSSPKSALPRHPSSSSVATSSNHSSHFVPVSRRVKLSLKQFDLNVEHDEEVTGDMISHIFETGPEGTDRIRLNGIAHVTVKTVLGILRLSVPLGQEHKLDIVGLDGLRNSPIHYTNFLIESGNPKYIQISLDVQSHNPAQGLTLSVPDSSLTLGVYYKDAFVGDVVLGKDGKGVVINPGPVSISGVEFRYRPTEKSEAQAQAMLSKLFTGEACQLAIRGHKKSSINSALTQALRLVDVPITIQPLGDNSILELIRVQLGVSVLTSNSIDATYYLNNPTGLPIDVLHLDVKAYHRSQPFGQATKTYTKEGVLTGKLSDGTPAGQFGTDGNGNTPKDPKSVVDGSRRTSTSSGNPRLQRLLIPPNARKFQGGLIVKLNTPLDQLVAAFLKERGSIVLDVNLHIRLDIGGYVIPDFDYRQKVPLEVHGLQGVARILRLI